MDGVSSRAVGPVAVVVLAIAGSTCRSPAAPTPLETFTITGVVRSIIDQSPVDAAAVRATGYAADGEWVERATTTDVSGTYRVDGLREHVAITVTKFGFYKAVSNTDLTANAIVDFTMIKAPPYLAENGDLVLNHTFSGSIAPTDLRCDPQWDSKAPCRHYGFTSTATREYAFSLSFPGCEIELHVFGGGRRLLYVSGRNSLSQSLVLPPGDYLLRLMAYYSCDEFDITVR